jgi:hypothetical protein
MASAETIPTSVCLPISFSGMFVHDVAEWEKESEQSLVEWIPMLASRIETAFCKAWAWVPSFHVSTSSPGKARFLRLGQLKAASFPATSTLGLFSETFGD